MSTSIERFIRIINRIMAVTIYLVFSLVWLLPRAQGYFVGVDAHAEECFFDRVSSGMKMGLTFEVVEGGFLDIDVKVNLFNAHHHEFQ